jgi:2-C-methyl-D-erythritol 4-phosphate cytidylyltransferase
MTKQYSDLSILIPAAGAGERLGLGPKALLNLNGAPLISWVYQRALLLTDEVIISVPPGHSEIISQCCPEAQCIEGGETRQESVDKLLVNSTRNWVLLSDVARPFISQALYRRVYQAAQSKGAAAAFLSPEVPVAHIVDGEISAVFSRSEMGVFQLPNVYAKEMLQSVCERTHKEGWEAQSTVELVLNAGFAIEVVEGEKNNIKITTKEDWRHAQIMAELLL